MGGLEWFGVGLVLFGALAYWCTRPVDMDDSHGHGHGDGAADFVRPPVPPPKDFTKEDLKPCRGENGAPMYVAVNGVVFDMTSHPSGMNFYGPGSPYHAFTGRDASVMLARMDLDPANCENVADTELSYSERDTMMDWFHKFESKYNIVGYLTDGCFAKSVKTETGGAVPEGQGEGAPVPDAASESADAKARRRK